MNKNNIKKIVIVVIFILLVGGAFLLSLKDEKEDSNTYLIINNQLWTYNNGWKSIENKDINKTLNVYLDNNYKGKYLVKYTDKYYIYDNKNQVIENDGEILASTLDLNLDLKQYTTSDNFDEDINDISKIIKSNIKLEEISNKEKIMVDLNNDGILDKIVNITNTESEESDIYFNLVYAVINGEIKIIVKDIIPAKDALIAPVYYIKDILNINKEQMDTIILRISYYSLSGETNYIMYRYQENDYQKIVE